MTIVAEVAIFSLAMGINLILFGVATYVVYKFVESTFHTIKSKEDMTNLRIDLLTKKIVELQGS